MTMLWTHQEEAIAYAESRRIVILHYGMGTGKTRTAIEILLRILRERESLLALVCCPKAVIRAWEKQIGMWAPDIRCLPLVKGTCKAKAKQVETSMADKSPLVIVGNYETTRSMPVLSKLPYDAFVYDECHKLKSGTGAASKWAANISAGNQDAKIIGLSGTLVPHSFLDLWGIYRALEYPECPTFGRYKTSFVSRYAVTNPHVPGMIVSWRNEPEIAKKLEETTLHRKSEDVLDLPELLSMTVEVDLSPREASVYRQLDREFAAEIEIAGREGRITPANHLVSLIRTLQCCQGWAKLDDEDEAVPLDKTSSKAEALADLLDGLPAREPVVIFCRFRGDITSCKAVCERLGRSVSELSGTSRQLEEWQDGKTDVLVAQIQSGGIGIDLTRASYGCFFSLSHSLAEYLQAIARLHRPGQTKTTRFYSLVSTLQGDTTVDGRVHQALEQRREVIDAVVDYYRTQRGS